MMAAALPFVICWRTAQPPTKPLSYSAVIG